MLKLLTELPWQLKTYWYVFMIMFTLQVILLMKKYKKEYPSGVRVYRHNKSDKIGVYFAFAFIICLYSYLLRLKEMPMVVHIVMLFVITLSIVTILVTFSSIIILTDTVMIHVRFLWTDVISYDQILEIKEHSSGGPADAPGTSVSYFFQKGSRIESLPLKGYEDARELIDEICHKTKITFTEEQYKEILGLIKTGCPVWEYIWLFVTAVFVTVAVANYIALLPRIIH